MFVYGTIRKRSVIPHIINTILLDILDVGLEKNMRNLRKKIGLAMLIVAAFGLGLFVSDRSVSSGDEKITAGLDNAVELKDEVSEELAKMNTHVSSIDEQSSVTPAVSIENREVNTNIVASDKPVADEESISSVRISNTTSRSNRDQKTEKEAVIASIETTETPETTEPVVETNEAPIAEQTSEEVNQPVQAPTPQPATIVIEDNSQQVIDEYNAIADAAIAEVLDSLSE